MALSPISDAEVALPTPVWEGGEGGSSGKRKAVLWITQEVGTQRSPAECGEPGVLVHAYTPNIGKDQEFKGHPLLYNMKSAWLREALLKAKQNQTTVELFLPIERYGCSWGRKGLETRTAEERRKSYLSTTVHGCQRQFARPAEQFCYYLLFSPLETRFGALRTKQGPCH